MRDSPLWRDLRLGHGPLYKVLRFVLIVGGLLVLLFTGILDLTWPQQAVLSLLTVLLAVWVDRSSGSYLVTLTLMLASMYSTFRYGFWRVSHTMGFFLNPGNRWSFLDAFFIVMLLGAEAYAFMMLFFGYIQTLWPLRRSPVALPDDPELWPEVDLLIPTLNEPLSVVRYTVLAAINIDWPADRLHVYLLDDGRREEFRAFAEEAGVGYIARADNIHAKAGNINHALTQVSSPFVAIFDCDHVATRSFLQLSMGWFLRDKKLGILQTPQHFYSPDPFEKNLGQFRRVPNEGELFYGVVQDGNDFWNATYFCGSCAVLRRAALDEVGGMAVETVTEDAHTSLRMQRRGWNTAYINIPQAAGLAAEGLSEHIRQRIRWARGMVQILRVENPLFARGLDLPQRICYFNAMAHFLYALPRLIFLTAPLVYLILGETNIPGYWAAILAYAIPHLVLSSMTNSRIQGRHRFSFWNEIYETVLAPYILLPTLMTLVSPKLGSFDVTRKGGSVHDGFFDARRSQPFLLLIALNVVGLFMAVFRFFYFPLPLLRGFYDGGHAGTILMNSVWACFNIVLLGVAVAVAWESQQRRREIRVEMKVDADVTLASGAVLHGVTADVSTGGARFHMEHGFIAIAGAAVKLTFHVLDEKATLPAKIVALEGRELRAKFDVLTMPDEEALTRVLYSRADAWLGWGEAREVDRPLRSLRLICKLSFLGLKQALFKRPITTRLPEKSSIATAALLMLLWMLAPGAFGEQQSIWNFPLPLQGKTAPEISGGSRSSSTAPQNPVVSQGGVAPATETSAGTGNFQQMPGPSSRTAAQNDLKLLPLPFYDAEVQQTPVVPIVFLRPPSSKALKAAGIVASWLGGVADSRPIRFSVAIGKVPTGNVILLSEDTAELPPALRPDAGFGPTIAMRTNPSDAYSNVLVVTGDTADEMVTAASALALRRDLLQGNQVRVSSLNLPPMREPDDAPRWLRTDKIIRFGDLRAGDSLQADGTVPVTVTMRLAPDLYYGDLQDLGLHLMLRYNGTLVDSGSTLQLSMNGSYVDSVPLPHTATATTQVTTTVPIPVSDLRPFSNVLAMNFGLIPSGKVGAGGSLQGAVLKDSYLDLRNIPHWAVLPNLELFSNAGYPFTRRADLADTSVVLPDVPTADEIELFLTLMGHFGAQTGYPVLHVEVTDAAGMTASGGKDYLVLGTVADQSAIRSLGRWLPVMVDGSGLHVQDIQGFFAFLQHAWWKVRSSDHVQSGELEVAGGLPDALIEGLEWPRGSNRSVVVIALRDHAAVTGFLTAFLEKAESSEISQSVSVLHGRGFVSYRIGNTVYRVGSLSLWLRLNLLFSQFPWLMVISTMVICLVLATLFRSMLRRHARMRLQGTV